MKKRAFILIGVAIIAITSMSNIVLPLADQAQWSNYTQRWNTKIQLTQKSKKKQTKKESRNITMCGPKKAMADGNGYSRKNL